MRNDLLISQKEIYVGRRSRLFEIVRALPLEIMDGQGNMPPVLFRDRKLTRKYKLPGSFYLHPYGESQCLDWKAVVTNPEDKRIGPLFSDDAEVQEGGRVLLKRNFAGSVVFSYNVPPGKGAKNKRHYCFEIRSLTGEELEAFSKKTLTLFPYEGQQE